MLTASSFITYRAVPHLDQKHTVFGKVVRGIEILDALERVAVDDKSRPLKDIKMNSVRVFKDPFEDFLVQVQREEEEKKYAESNPNSKSKKEEMLTWTGKRVGNWNDKSEGPQIGKYVKLSQSKK